MHDSPEVQAGRRLDSHHDPVVRVLTACTVCGFNTSDAFDLGLRHLPLPTEVKWIDAWLVNHPDPPAAGPRP